jgi:phosphoglycolate phosphatase-like HAD superfamily hydrolase
MKESETAKAAKRLYEATEKEQEDATDEAESVEELRYVVAYYAGFREALRRLFPGIDEALQQSD